MCETVKYLYLARWRKMDSIWGDIQIIIDLGYF